MTVSLLRLIRVGLFFFPLLFAVFLSSASANNLSVSSVTIASRSATADTATIQFDISWSNSWRNQSNWDAAWVFMKYSTDAGVTWAHAILKTSGTDPSGFSTGAGTGITTVVPTDKYGGFIYRSSVGSGSLSTTAVKFVWDYGTSGVSDTASVIIKVFGIEMVHIPAESFYAGDGSTSSLTGQFESGTTSAALQITSEAQLTLGGGGGGSLGNNNASGMGTVDDFNDGTSRTLVAAFPKGYAAYYLMKYEITQGQYTDFLNTLTRLQQNRRVGSDVTGDAPASGRVWVMSAQSSSTYRNEIKCPASGNGTTNPITFSTTRSDRACNYLSWMDFAAFSDWAALRPMTELELEKAARGPLAAVIGAQAWGNTSVTAAATISGTENGTETITTSGANCNYNNTNFSGGDTGIGPLRAGIFATASSTRATSGAGYYGNMEITGNVYELVVCVGTTTGRSFTGTHGDGTVTTTASYEGNATNSDWPGIDGTPARGITGATGSGGRASGFGETSTNYGRVSDRYWANYLNTTHGYAVGGRSARTAP